ncbi:MAG: putative aminopeptidase NPEPL1 [Planctomycetota bacterium]|jgi:probable aminopeptidase NPEPL1
MTRIRITKSLPSLLKGIDALLIIAPKSRFDDGSFLDALPEPVMRLALDLASDLDPGLTGIAAGTLTGDAPRKLAIGVLPDEVSRHNSPARAEAIRRVVAQSSTGKSGSAAILMVLDQEEHFPAAACGVARALPLFQLTRKKGAAPAGAKAESKPVPKLGIMAIGPDEAPIAPPKWLQSVMDYSREAGRLVDTPPTDLNPKAFQDEAAKLLRGVTGLTRKAFVGDALLRAGLGGIHAVGRTALDEPRMLVFTYKPAAKTKAKKHIALVGKGVTYDTGGLSLKISGGMVGMKMDMGGAAAVLGAFCALVKGGAPCTVSAVICLAENAIGPAAYKNDDVIWMHSGKSVEINNTDAEGRLLLADGVSYAARKLKADIVIDIATLTGAQGVATGVLHGGLVADDGEIEATMIEAGRKSGDLVHPMPYAPEFYRSEFKSHIADMRNSVANRANAQASCAAEFVHWHMADTDARWVHVDMAYPAMRGGRATGFGVALLAQAVRDLA